MIPTFVLGNEMAKSVRSGAVWSPAEEADVRARAASASVHGHLPVLAEAVVALGGGAHAEVAQGL